EFARDITAFYLINELKTRNAIIGRTDLKDDIGKLTTATRLFLVYFAVFNLSCNGFLISYLGSTLVAFHLEFTLKPVPKDLQVQLTHPADHGLPAVGINLHTECRILFGQFPKSNAELVNISLGPGLNGNTDHRIRES